MAELREDQIDAAAKVLCKTGGNKWDDSYKGQRESYYAMAKAAAPFLQFPWDEPTSEEINALDGKDHTYTMVREFVSRRNALQMPKPLDQRRAAIVEVLKQYPDRAPEIADKILAALDEVK